MTLDEYMEGVSDTVCIGAKDGSNYFFFGNYEDYKRDIANWNETFKRRTKYGISEKINEIGVWERKLEKAEDYAKKNIQKKIDHLHKLMKRKEVYLAEFTDLQTREVIELRDKYYDVRAIIIEGAEQGNFWTMSEYKPPK